MKNNEELKKQFNKDFAEAMQNLIDKYSGTPEIGVIASALSIDEKGTGEINIAVMGDHESIVFAAGNLLKRDDVKPFFKEAIFQIIGDLRKENDINFNMN